ncbi:MAG: SCO family protein [Acidobacteriota bacterium]|nr:SCO family protein [Acidobacteriota bacterium]
MTKTGLLPTILIGLLPLGAFAQLDTKPLIEDVGIDEHLGELVDLELEFTDRNGKQVRLAELLEDEKPTIFAPVYYTCPSLCTLILDGQRDLINELELQLGVDYRVVNISFNPENTPELARDKANNYIATLRDPRPADHWYFLTGKAGHIQRFMNAVGFRYKKIDELYSHASVLVLTSPKGKITRYIYGVQFDPKTVRMALIEASDGKVGSTLERMLIYCFKYDPLAGKYVPWAWGFMRIGAAASALTLLVLVVILWKAESTRKRRLGQDV